MGILTVILTSLVLLCGIRDGHADTNMTSFSGQLRLLNNFHNLELSLKKELTKTFIPALIKRQVRQAMADILKEDHIENIISGHVLDVVNSLKASIHHTKTQLRSVKEQFRHVKRERDTYKKSLGKLRSKLTKDLRTLNKSCVMMRQEIEQRTNDEQSCREGLQRMQQKIQELEERDALHEKHIQDLTEQKQKVSSQESRQTERVTQIPMTTQESDLHASSDPSRSEKVSRPPVTTQKPATQATPSPATCRDLHVASERGNLEKVRRILSTNNGVVNCRGVYSSTPVMRAAWNRHRDVVEFLVSRGADVTLVTDDGYTLLNYACIGGDVEMVKFVLSLPGVDINARDNGGADSGRRGERLGTSGSGETPGVPRRSVTSVSCW